MFALRRDFTPARNAPLGTTIQQELTREFHVDSLVVEISGTITNAATAMGVDALAALLKRLTITVSDGAVTRTVVSASGRGLLERHVQLVGALDAGTTTALAITTGTGPFTLRFPVWFAPPQIKDPVRSLFLLPAPRYNSNIVVEAQIATASEVATGSFNIAGGVNFRIVVDRRVVDAVNWLTFDTEQTEYTQLYPTTGANQAFDLPIPGSVTGILLRTYTSATARGDITIANGEWKLQALGVNFQRFRLPDLAAINDHTVFANRFAGSYYIDFLSDVTGSSVDELTGLLDLNVYAATGAKCQLIGDVTGGAGVRADYFIERIYGDLSRLKLRGK